MKDMMFNKLLEISNISRYPEIHQKHVETGAQHSTEIGLISLYILGDVLNFVKDYPDSRDIEYDAREIAIKALLFDHTIEGYQIGSVSTEHKYYAAQLKKKLNLAYLFDAWHSIKDDSIESYIVKLADFLTNLRKCIIETKTDNRQSMIPIAEELKEHLLFERDRLNKSTLPLGVKTYLINGHTQCLSILNDEVLTQALPPPAEVPVAEESGLHELSVDDPVVRAVARK